MSAESPVDKTCDCRLCGGQADFSFSERVLNRHQAAYYLCPTCGLLQSEQPYWLDEAYGEALSSADTGVMQRNLHLMKVTSVLLRMLRLESTSFLDYGGGHGVFTRLMRDHGFDFYCWDKHADNLFAQGFEGNLQQGYDGVTAFEVLEHLVDPKDFFRQILGEMKPKLLLVGTELFAEPVNPAWYYFYFPTGQHIAFYQPKTLDWLAEQYGYRRISSGGLHLFVRPSMAAAKLRWALHFGARLYSLFRFRSRVAGDHQATMRKLGGDGTH